MDWNLRLADEADIPAIDKLIPLSVRALQAPYYTSAQMDAAIGPIFGVDRQLIKDRTYFVAEARGHIVGCGAWSKRKATSGGDQSRTQDDFDELDPRRDPARIRAFFVHPDWARQGIGRSILAACEKALQEAGFFRVELVGTLAGEPLYAAFGYQVIERYEMPITNGLGLPVVRMSKQLKPACDQ
jgi:predicted N-acetyltransferase YhbS